MGDSPPAAAASGPIFLEAGSSSGGAAAGFLAKTRTLGGMPIVSATPSANETVERAADAPLAPDPTEGTQSLQLASRDELKAGENAEVRSTPVWLAVLIALLAVGGIVVGSLAVLFNETETADGTASEVTARDDVFLPPEGSAPASMEPAAQGSADPGPAPEAPAEAAVGVTESDSAPKDTSVSTAPEPAPEADAVADRLADAPAAPASAPSPPAQEAPEKALSAPKTVAAEPVDTTAKPEPTPEPVVFASEEAPSTAATGQSTAAPDAAAASPAPAADPCLVLVSQPIGAKVWINGKKHRRRALSSSASGFRRAAGTIEVGMGSGDAPEASTKVDLSPGASILVECDLQVAGSCSSRAVPAGRCGN
ncbi:MAG TPA: hypothetical protein DIU15_09215 [Deltaproteobacteria bacterium]|nr:hypothetical protein [Deltaproteobacteria bacterium]